MRRFIIERELIHPGARVLAGVSGGPDSTCLLLTLAALRRPLRFDLHAAYFDHGLRGARAAEQERNAVRSLCEALDVPFRSGAGDVRAHAKARRLSIEEAARELRYRFLASAAGARPRCDTVAVGHTRDDQAETVLLHLIRGSGMRGLAGIAASSSWPVSVRGATPRLVRPLLALSRDDTERCCRTAGVTPLRDPSNTSRAHLRNRIRLELLPSLRRYNPRVDEALARLADSAAGDIDVLEQLAEKAIERDRGASTLRISRARLASLPDALRPHAVRLAIARLLGDTRQLSERHIRSVLRAAEQTGARLDLPRSLHIRVDRAHVTIAVGRAASPRALPARAVRLPVPGSARLGGWTISSELVRRPLSLANANGRVAVLDAEACGRALRLRRRRPGDRFQPLGMARAKKLQDFFVDAHVPRDERDAVPLVCAERGIAWVVGQRPAEWAKVHASTRTAVRLTATQT